MRRDSIPDLVASMHPSLETRNSHIHGTGLFAATPLASGTVIIRFGGFFFTASSRADALIVEPSTAVGVSESTIIGEHAGTDRDISDYINHSCGPNLGMLDALTLVTIADVGEGAELTADYAYWESDADYEMPRKCRCGVAKCRSTITGNDWRMAADCPHLVQWSSPYIRRRIQALTEE